jgi:hypothetical protein
MEFVNTCDYTYLADELGIEVTSDDIEEAKSILEKYNINLMMDDELKREKTDELKKVDVKPIVCYDKDDFKREIKRIKLKEFIWDEILGKCVDISANENGDEDYQNYTKIIREFVQQHAEDSFASDHIFWEKLSDIDDDWVFFKMVSENLKSLSC